MYTYNIAVTEQKSTRNFKIFFKKLFIFSRNIDIFAVIHYIKYMKSIRCTIVRDNQTSSVLINPYSKVKTLNRSKVIPAKKLQIGDVFKDNWKIIELEKEKRITPKSKEIKIINNLQQLVSLLQDKFKDDVWQLDSVKDLLDQYNIVLVKTLFNGIYIENVFTDSVYVAGEIMSVDFYVNPINNINYDLIETLTLI